MDHETLQNLMSAAVGYATEMGRENGESAAVLAIAEGTVAERPEPDLSGEWAGRITGSALVSAALVAALDDIGDSSDPDDILAQGLTYENDICEAYERAFAAAVDVAMAPPIAA
jgi:hypothetical protein